MADHQAIINDQIYKLIPFGFCACGCGGKTKIAKKTQASSGRVKGQPTRFVYGHSGRDRECSGYPALGSTRKHILAAKKALGKPIPAGVVVHHANGSKDSGPLVICQDTGYHRLLHQRITAYRACGHASWRKCWICQKYDKPENVYIGPNHGSGHHIKCNNDYIRSGLNIHQFRIAKNYI